MRRIPFLAFVFFITLLGWGQEQASKPVYPLLKKVFRADLSKEQATALVPSAPLEKILSALTPDQKLAARTKLQAAEAEATTPEALAEIAHGFLMLDERSSNRGQGAARVAERLQQLEPRNPIGFTLAARAQQQMGDYSSAAKLAQDALDLDPNDADARAVLLLTQGRSGGSQAHSIPASIPTTPQSFFSGTPEAAGFINQAVAARKAGDMEKSWAFVQAAMRADPNSPGVQEFYRMAQADQLRHRQNKTKQAERSHDQPIKESSGPEDSPSNDSMPLWPIGALAGLGLAGYGLARSKSTLSVEEDVGHNVQIDLEDDARWKRHAKAVVLSAGIGVAVVYGGPMVWRAAAPALTSVWQGGGASLQRVATSQTGALNPRGVFEIHPRVIQQLADSRLGPLAGKLTPADLQRLANNPTAQRVFDTRSGNMNIIQEVDGVLLRITVPANAMKIISVGPIRSNQVTNRLASGDFIPRP